MRKRKKKARNNKIRNNINVAKELSLYLFAQKPIKRHGYYVCANCGFPVSGDKCEKCGRMQKY